MKNYKLLMCLPLVFSLFSCDSQQQTTDKSEKASVDTAVEKVTEAVEATKEVVESVEQEIAVVEEKAEQTMEQAAEVVEQGVEQVEAAVSAVVEKTSASGQDIYQKSCVGCHGTGAANAPKLGDTAAWKTRIDKGMDALYASAVNGVPGTAMMAKGTCGACSEEELRSAVDYMVEKSR